MPKWMKDLYICILKYNYKVKELSVIGYYCGSNEFTITPISTIKYTFPQEYTINNFIQKLKDGL